MLSPYQVELLKEFAVQAGFGYDSGYLLAPTVQHVNDEMQKFAELILSNKEQFDDV